ncbi:MAG: TadE/TadG family type IV pilus assembly protein [Planctomycetota bacterium]
MMHHGKLARRHAGRRRSTDSRKGAAVVEFAIVAPLMFMLFFSMVEIGRAVMVAQLAVNASREGCRQAAQTGSSTTDVSTFVKDYLQASGIANGAVTVQIQNQTVTNGAFGTTTNLSTVPTGMGVRVNISINFADVTWLPDNFAYAIMPNNAKISGSTTMRKE